jgi:glycosyltransferase involved in cell wall biosynthesis
MERRPVTSLVLPAYNPGPAVERTWVAVREFARSRREPWEVVFVCDGCTDGTGDRLRKLAGRGRTGFDVQVIDYPHNARRPRRVARRQPTSPPGA